MGLEGLSLRHLLVVLVIVALVFGTKKLRNAGGDLGAAMKSFRRAMRDHDEEEGSVAAAERASLGQDSQDAGHAAPSSAAKSAERS